MNESKRNRVETGSELSKINDTIAYSDKIRDVVSLPLLLRGIMRRYTLPRFEHILSVIGIIPLS